MFMLKMKDQEEVNMAFMCGLENKLYEITRICPV